jgi:hypothetical protein
LTKYHILHCVTIIDSITITFWVREAIAVAQSLFFTKVIEKPGENLGQELWDKTQNLIGRLKGKSDTLTNLLEGNKQQPLDYGEAVSQAIRVVKLALEVDWILGAKLAGEVKSELQLKTVEVVEVTVHSPPKKSEPKTSHSQT